MSFDDESKEEAAVCEIGSLEMPPAEWLFSAAASFQQSYGQVHPYLAAGLCIAGTLMNLVTVIVLTRASMRSPVNVLLCAVAICDIVVMGSYLIFVLHFLIASASRCEPSDFSYGWALFMMFHAHASVIFHAASIWMTVSLAQIRVLTIRRATAGPTTPLITGRFTAVLAVLTTIVMTLVNVPNFITFEIMEVPASAMLSCLQPPMQEMPLNSPPLHSADSTRTASALQKLLLQNVNGSTSTTTIDDGHNATNIVALIAEHLANNNLTLMRAANRTRRQHRLRRFRRDTPFNAAGAYIAEPLVYTVRAHDRDCMKLKLSFWSNGMLFKVIPCLLLTLSIVALLRIIADVSHKRKNLAQVMRKKVPKDHTTPMLAAILLIFLLAELPQGVFLVLNGIFSSESFHKRVYLPLGDLMDLLSLLNSAVGFLIYVGMSRKFRTVFLQLLFSALSCICSGPLPCCIRLSKKGGNQEDGAGGGMGAAEHGDHQRWQNRGGTANSSRRASAMFSGGTALYSQCMEPEQGQQPAGTRGEGDEQCRWTKKRFGTRGGQRCTKKDKKATEGRWIRWRKLSSRPTTDVTSRTEQLSLCPSSLLGLPPLTLAVSCSAGITAAAATVGVHLLSLDNHSNASSTAPSRSASKNALILPNSVSSSNLLLIVPNNNNNSSCSRKSSHSLMLRKGSNASGNSNSIYLEVPMPLAVPSSKGNNGSGLTTAAFNNGRRVNSPRNKRASFHSLRDHKMPNRIDEEGDEEEEEGKRHNSYGNKRISFNLPPSFRAEDDNDATAISAECYNASAKGDNGETTNGEGRGFSARIRRSFLLSLGLAVAKRKESKEDVEDRLNGTGSANALGNFAAKGGHSLLPDPCDCPAKALLKMQLREGGKEELSLESRRHQQKTKKYFLSTSVLTFARSIMGRLNWTNANLADNASINSTGSGSPQRKMCALRAETNFPGWTYC